MPFITDQFLLHNAAGRRLYERHAAGQPILDYHCHLPPRDIAENRQFRQSVRDLARGRSLQVAGDAGQRRRRALLHRATPRPCEKFQAWAATVPHTLRNPLYHWTHLELERYFGIDDLLDETTAESIWERANARLAADELRARGILAEFHVRALCTTDDPADEPRMRTEQIRDVGARRPASSPRSAPTGRSTCTPPDVFNPWVDRLAAAADIDIARLRRTCSTRSSQRHGFFHDLGGRLSDHGLDTCYADPCSDAEARRDLRRRARRAGRRPRPTTRSFASFMMLFFGRLDAEKGWTKQLHLGALPQRQHAARSRELGRDTGFDSIGDWPQIDAARRLPRSPRSRRTRCRGSILYNVNPTDNYALGHDDRQLPGRHDARQDPVRQRLVVPRSEGGHGVAAQRAVEHRAAVPFRRHADRLALVHVVPAARVLSAACCATSSGATSSAASCRPMTT